MDSPCGATDTPEVHLFTQDRSFLKSQQDDAIEAKNR
jgi:hypothetical protein